LDVRRRIARERVPTQLLDWIQGRGELQSVLAFLPIEIRNGQTDAHWLRASDGSKTWYPKKD